MELIILVWITGSYESPNLVTGLKTKSTKHTFPFRSIISWNEEKSAFLAKDLLPPYLLLSTSHPIINASCIPLSLERLPLPFFKYHPLLHRKNVKFFFLSHIAWNHFVQIGNKSLVELNKNASLELELISLGEYLRCNFIQRVNSFLWNKIQDAEKGERV